MAQGADRSVASVGAARQRARWGRVRALEVRISRVLAEYGRAAAAPTTGSTVGLVSMVEELDGAEEELAVAMTWTDYPRAQVWWCGPWPTSTTPRRERSTPLSPTASRC